MIEISLQKLSALFDQVLTDCDIDQVIRGVTIDSRKTCHGQLFVAIKGDQFDGHLFVEAAFKNGAIAALVERRLDIAMPQVLVADCRLALAKLANYWRHSCNAKVVALTGSNGKTTVKEMLHHILAKDASTHATRGNFNNDIGVPLTLFELSPEDEYAIIELGANHRGEIATLAQIAEPDIVYVNNVAASHLTGFGSVQGVIEAKGELYAYCKSHHQALFNIDEVASQQWRASCKAGKQFGCALNADADIVASWQQNATGIQLEFNFQGRTEKVSLEIYGEHNARNALAAVSLATIAGVEFNRAVSSLKGFSGVDGRQQMLRGPKQSRLIDDSYNANPDSLEAGISVLCSLPGAPWLAMGDMGELGEASEKLHRQAALTARQYGVEKLFGIGPLSCIACDEFGESGYCFDSIQEMAAAILETINRNVNLLVKGSRSAGMDRLVKVLSDDEKSRDRNHAL